MSKATKQRGGVDPELEQLMRQVAEGRKKDKDYRSLEDQIRCLKLRLSN